MVQSGKHTPHTAGLSKGEECLWAQQHQPAFRVGKPISEYVLTQRRISCLVTDGNTCAGTLEHFFFAVYYFKAFFPLPFSKVWMLLPPVLQPVYTNSASSTAKRRAADRAAGKRETPRGIRGEEPTSLVMEVPG